MPKLIFPYCFNCQKSSGEKCSTCIRNFHDVDLGHIWRTIERGYGLSSRKYVKHAAGRIVRQVEGFWAGKKFNRLVVFSLRQVQTF